MAKLTVECREFRRFKKNSLLGFCELYLPAMRLAIRGITVNRTSGKLWVGMPGKPMTDKAGNPLHDDRGRVKYLAFLQFETREVSDAFRDAVLAAVLAHDPRAFDDDDAPRREPQHADAD